MSAAKKPRHVDQDIPIEWEGFRYDGERFVAHDVPEGTVVVYRVVGTTTNARVVAQAEAVLYDGNLVHPWYEPEYRSVALQHRMAGTMRRLEVPGFLSEPLPVLEAVEADALSDL